MPCRKNQKNNEIRNQHPVDPLPGILLILCGQKHENQTKAQKLENQQQMIDGISINRNLVEILLESYGNPILHGASQGLHRIHARLYMSSIRFL